MHKYGQYVGQSTNKAPRSHSHLYLYALGLSLEHIQILCMEIKGHVRLKAGSEAEVIFWISFYPLQQGL